MTSFYRQGNDVCMRFRNRRTESAVVMGVTEWHETDPPDSWADEASSSIEALGVFSALTAPVSAL